MKPSSNFDEIMDEIRREHRALEAPKQLEALLSAETERKAGLSRLASPHRIWAWGLSFALVAGVLWGAAAWQMHRVHSQGKQQAGSISHTAPALRSLFEAEASTTPAPMQRGGRSVTGQVRAGQVHTSAVKGASQPNFRDGSMDDFVPLPASEGLPPASALSLVRMQIQQSALQQYGLEVPAEAEPKTLLAEFAVGEDGLPRAIRIIP